MKAHSVFILLMLAAALIGCSNDNEKEDQVSIHSCFTRSGTETIIVKDFGIFLSNNDGSAYNNCDWNIHVTYNGQWYIPKITLSKDNGTLSAYSPFDENCTYTNIPLDLSKQIDYLYSKGQTVNNSNASVSIELNHLLSKLVFLVEDNTPKIRIGNYPTTGTFNLFKRSIRMNDAKGTITTTSGSIYVFPGLSNTIEKVTLTYQNKDYDYIMPENTFEEGKEYVYRLSVNTNHELSLRSVNVTPWISGGNYQGNI